MIKKIYNVLILFFFISLLIFYGHGQSIKEFDKITNEYFNSTIYLESQGDQESSIKTLKSIANEYDLTIAKIIPNHDGSTDIFVYSHKNKYIDDFLYSNGFINNKGHSGEILQTFYNKRIYIKPLDDLKNIGIDGKFTLNVNNPFDLENLTKKINVNYGKILTIYPNQNLKNTFTAYVDNLKYFYGIILVAILFFTLLTSFLYDIKSRRKEIAVKYLFGYGARAVFHDILINKAVKPIAVSILISEIFVIPFFIFNKNIKTLETLKYFLMGSLKFSIIFALILIAIFSFILLINVIGKTNKLNMVSYIKGRANSRNILSILVKMGSTLLIIVSFSLSVV